MKDRRLATHSDVHQKNLYAETRQLFGMFVIRYIIRHFIRSDSWQNAFGRCEIVSCQYSQQIYRAQYTPKTKISSPKMEKTAIGNDSTTTTTTPADNERWLATVNTDHSIRSNERMSPRHCRHIRSNTHRDAAANAAALSPNRKFEWLRHFMFPLMKFP